MVWKILKIWSDHPLSPTFKMIKQPRPGIINSRWTKEMPHQYGHCYTPGIASLSSNKAESRDCPSLLTPKNLDRPTAGCGQIPQKSGLEATVQWKAKYLTSDLNSSKFSQPEVTSQSLAHSKYVSTSWQYSMTLQICHLTLQLSRSLSHTSHLRPCRIAAGNSPGVLRAFYSSVPRKDGEGRSICHPSWPAVVKSIRNSVLEETFSTKQQMAIKQGSRLR